MAAASLRRGAKHHEQRLLGAQIEGHDRLAAFDVVGDRLRRTAIGVPDLRPTSAHAEVGLDVLGSTLSIIDKVDLSIVQLAMQEAYVAIGLGRAVTEVRCDAQ